MSKHPQRRPRPMGMSERNYTRVKHEINMFRRTGEVSDWLAKKALRYDWVRYEAFPALKPPEPEFLFTFTGFTNWIGTFGSMNP